jgi:hypothetical protein
VQRLGRARIPVALHVCSDSREEAKEVYRLSFGLKGISTSQGSRWEVEPKIYFDFSRDILFLDTEGYRPCNSLRGMSFEVLRAEAKRFHCLVECVQDLREVKRLVAWEYLPMVAVHWFSHDDRKNPWSVFEGVYEGVVGAVGVASRIDDKNLKLVEPHPTMEGRLWDLAPDMELLTGLKWKQVWVAARSPNYSAWM